MTIFVAIPAYRDQELVPTVLDALAKAAAPQDLRFGICWQHAEGDSIAPLDTHPQVRIIEREYGRSRGVGWARSLAASLYDGEDYVLQTDSHMRFTPGWDANLIDECRRAPSDKPVLSTWPAHYVPGEQLKPGPALRIVFRAYDSGGAPTFTYAPISGVREVPVPAGFMCAGVVFTPGSFIAEVPNDPYIYFFGEEITTAVRAFTRGWDLFALTRHLLWHHWGGAATRVRHWNDHSDPADLNQWARLEDQSRRRVRGFLQSPSSGLYGVGSVRTYDEYQEYVGLDLRSASATASALSGVELPVYSSRSVAEGLGAAGAS
jgi:glycosyltransferase involved in cell wall biosynthesis